MLFNPLHWPNKTELLGAPTAELQSPARAPARLQESPDHAGDFRQAGRPAGRVDGAEQAGVTVVADQNVSVRFLPAPNRPNDVVDFFRDVLGEDLQANCWVWVAEARSKSVGYWQASSPFFRNLISYRQKEKRRVLTRQNDELPGGNEDDKHGDEDDDDDVDDNDDNDDDDSDDDDDDDDNDDGDGNDGGGSD